jgi:hypothetical protein
MRRIFAALGIAIMTAGAAALTPLFATLGAGLTLTAVARAEHLAMVPAPKRAACNGRGVEDGVGSGPIAGGGAR